MVPVTTALRVRPEAAGSAIAVDLVGDRWRFTALRGEWNELLRASAADCPFLTWEWMHTWWKHLGGGSSLQIAVVRDGQELIGLAPLRDTAPRLKPLSTLEFLGTGEAGSDYLDIIVRPGREAEAIAALARFATSRGTALRFNHVRPASMAARLADTLSDAGWIASDTADGTCPYISLAGHTWDSYLATIGSAHRANVRRRLRQLEQRFRVRFELVTDEPDRRDALDALARFHDRRYGSRGGSTAFSTPALRAFHDEVTRRAIDRGWMRLYVLRLDDDIAAVMYGFAHKGQFLFYQHGFDAQYQQHSVGLAVMALTIKAAIDEGLQDFDFLWGVESYKALWSHDARVLRRIELYPAGIGGRVHHQIVDRHRQLRRLARRVMSRGGSRGA
jgi:CelD/BcsL family acetyltransferase involved in cellulose biosynthesis